MDAHDHVGARLARAQGYRDRVGVTRERRAVLVNGSPPGIEGGPPADLFRRQPQDPLGPGVLRLQPALCIHQHNALRPRGHNRARAPPPPPLHLPTATCSCMTTPALQPSTPPPPQT